MISGDAQAHLEARRFTEDVTDYFDKANGHSALAAFIRGYVQPASMPGARVLYVEDSRTVAMATTRMLEAQGMQVIHVVSAEDAIEYLRERRDSDDIGADLVLSDVYLKGELSGRDLLHAIRNDLLYVKRRLPVLVMKRRRQSETNRVLREAPTICYEPVERACYHQDAVPLLLRASRTNPRPLGNRARWEARPWLTAGINLDFVEGAGRDFARDTCPCLHSCAKRMATAIASIRRVADLDAFDATHSTSAMVVLPGTYP